MKTSFMMRPSPRSAAPASRSPRAVVGAKPPAWLGDDASVGIVAGVLAAAARADLQQHRLAVRTVLEMMPVGDAGRKAGAVAGAQHRFATALDQHDLALEHEDELVLGAVPV